MLVPMPPSATAPRTLSSNGGTDARRPSSARRAGCRGDRAQQDEADRAPRGSRRRPETAALRAAGRHDAQAILASPSTTSSTAIACARGVIPTSAACTLGGMSRRFHLARPRRWSSSRWPAARSARLCAPRRRAQGHRLGHRLPRPFAHGRVGRPHYVFSTAPDISRALIRRDRDLALRAASSRSPTGNRLDGRDRRGRRSLGARHHPAPGSMRRRICCSIRATSAPTRPNRACAASPLPRRWWSLDRPNIFNVNVIASSYPGDRSGSHPRCAEPALESPWGRSAPPTRAASPRAAFAYFSSTRKPAS